MRVQLNAHPISLARLATGAVSIMRYHLSDEVHLCSVDAHVVILNLPCDRYLFLEPTASQQLRPHVDSLRSSTGLDLHQPASGLLAVLEHLVAKGLLTSVQSSVQARTPPPPSLPHAEIDLGCAPSGAIGSRDFARYLLSAICAAAALRLLPIHKVVSMQRHKAPARTSAASASDMNLASVLCAGYCRLRTLTTGPQECLFESLTLKLFLARYGLFPEWVFGVRLEPFSAHCWLQFGHVLLNDSLQFVRTFTPIMAV